MAIRRESRLAGIRCIVGLGNPGAQYEKTRHNAGFWLLDILAEQTGVFWRYEAKFHGESCRWESTAGSLWLLKPQTFMNASGRSVQALGQFFKIVPEEILVVHDELDLPPGEARLKKGGGHAGHNGLKDIAACLGTPLFWRVRLGVGRPPHRGGVDFVLSAPPAQEWDLIHHAIHETLAVLPNLLAGEWDRAMNQLHQPKKAPKISG